MDIMITFARMFLGWLFQTTLIASLVICLILLIQKLLGGRLGARWCHALWLVLIVRMVLPWAPSSRLSLLNLIPSWDRQAQSQRLTGIAEQTEVSPFSETAENHEAIPDQESRSEATVRKVTTPKPQTLTNVEGKFKSRLVFFLPFLPILWLAGAIVIGAYLFVSNFSLWRIIKRDHPLVNQLILELFEECKAQMGVQSLVVVVPSKSVSSPGLFGFLRPRLLLPKKVLDTATVEELRYVFLHELAHLKRHDIYLGWLTSLLQVLHWFNPFIWFAFYRMRTDRELACDALVLTRTGQDKSQEYGGAIVDLLRRFSRSRRLPAMAGIIESKSQLKRRITMITKFKNKSYRFSPLSAVLIIILACISLPDAEHTRASKAAASTPTSQPKFIKIRIPTMPQNGVLSPDGNKLAFVSDGAMWVVPLHGKVDPDIAGEPVRLAEVPGIWDNGSLMAWSANGEWIAVNTWPDAKDVFVHVIPAAGGKPRVVQMPGRGSHAWSYRVSLSPDGQRLAFSALELHKPRQETSDKQDRYICTIPTAGGEPKQLSSGWGRMPSFSPDGETIAYVDAVRRQEKERVPLGGELWIVPAEGGTPVKLASVEGRLRGPVWSPDGKYIAAHREPGATNNSKEIWVFPLSPDASSAGEPKKVALPCSSWNMLAGWTPKGQLGVFLTPEAHHACYTVPASGGRATQITPESTLPYYPRWSPDGERIYFRGVGGQNALLSYVPPTGGKVGTVPLQTTERLVSSVPGGGHNISPDGKRIVVSASHDIWTIRLDDGLLTRLTNDDSHEAYPCWSPDGRLVAFIDEVNYAIYIVPAGGGEIRQVSSESDRVRGSGAITFSPDGKRIAFLSGGSIKTIPVEGGEPTILIGKVKSGYHSQLAYSPDGSKIAHNARGKIWITQLDGGKPEELQTGLPEGARLSDFGWSPDGEKIAFVGTIGGEPEFWLIDNFLPDDTGK